MRAANNRLQWTVKDKVPTHHGNYGRTKVESEQGPESLSAGDLGFHRRARPGGVWSGHLGSSVLPEVRAAVGGSSAVGGGRALGARSHWPSPKTPVKRLASQPLDGRPNRGRHELGYDSANFWKHRRRFKGHARLVSWALHAG